MRDDTRLNPTLSNQLSVDLDTVELYYHGVSHTLKSDDLPFLIGRDENDCHMVVQNNLTSRKHCTLEIQEGQFGVRDHSMNGTMVKIGRSEAVFIRNKFCPLSGQGRIKMGSSMRPDDEDVVLFKVTLVHGPCSE